MRYLILVCSFSALYMIVMAQAAPEKTDSGLYYAGLACCSLQALVITWNDKSEGTDGLIGAVMNALIPLAGIALTVYGAGSKLGYFGNNAQTEDFVNTSFIQLTTICLITGLLLLLISAIRIWLSRMHKS